MPLTYKEGAALAKPFIHAIDGDGNNVSVVALHPESAGGSSGGGGGAVFDFEVLLVRDEEGNILVRKETATDPSQPSTITYTDLTTGEVFAPVGMVRPWEPSRGLKLYTNEYSFTFTGPSGFDLMLEENINRVSYRIRNTSTATIYLGGSGVIVGTGTIVLKPGDVLIEDNPTLAATSLYGISDAENAVVKYTEIVSPIYP